MKLKLTMMENLPSAGKHALSCSGYSLSSNESTIMFENQIMAYLLLGMRNVVAVTSTSTRTSIYKAFAKGENLGDDTAKGECISNITDLLGTGLSIMPSKRNPSLVTTFAFLSCDYLFSFYREVCIILLILLLSFLVCTSSSHLEMI